MALKTDLTLGLFSFIAIHILACTNKKSEGDIITPIEENTSKRIKQYNMGGQGNDPVSLGFKYAESNDRRALDIADSLILYGETNVAICDGFYLKGIYYANLNNPDKAISYFDSAILTNYTFTEPYIEKAILLHEEKKFDLALDLLTKASELDRYNPEIYYWMAKNHEAKKDHEEALFYYEQTLVLDPNFTNVKKAIDNIKNNLKTTDKN